ncbi:MAG: hypothetical protein OEV30_12590 [Ignavibacteria bacterium]|nr:hypothetical protein [Ignavibacteria bacterium]
MTGLVWVSLLAGVLILPGASASSQERHEGGLAETGKEIVSFYIPFVFPKVFQDVTRLRELVSDDEFLQYRLDHGDLMAVDRIFAESMDITWGNTYETLLICTFAVMDHRNFGVRLPVVGALFWVPLSSEFEEEFQDRIANLPQRIYPDTPLTGAGDRDKLQHFFGSAFLACVSESREGAERVGSMVEYGESQFIVGGRHDDRDLRANQHGRSFGMALLGGADVVPSDFLQLYTAGSVDRGIAGPATTLSGTCGYGNAINQE